MILSVIAIIISSIAVVISGLTFYYHFLLKAIITVDYSNDNQEPYFVEGIIGANNYKWVRIKALCSNKILNVSAKNLHLKMLSVEKYDSNNKKWDQLNPINFFDLRWVNDKNPTQFTYYGDLTRYEPQYFNLATLVNAGGKQLLYPGIPNQGNVAGWNPNTWFTEGYFRYTIGAYGDNVKFIHNKTHTLKIEVVFAQGWNVSFCNTSDIK